MYNKTLTALLLICVLAIYGCASNGVAVKPPPVCPVPPPVPASLMQAPTYEQQVRQQLFELPPTQTPASARSSG